MTATADPEVSGSVPDRSAIKLVRECARLGRQRPRRLSPLAWLLAGPSSSLQVLMCQGEAACRCFASLSLLPRAVGMLSVGSAIFASKAPEARTSNMVRRPDVNRDRAFVAKNLQRV
jgi:hypothetical protein